MRNLILTATSLLLTICVAACSQDATPQRTPASAPQQEAISRIGDVTIRANAIATSSLSEGVAREYGIHRDANTVMLLVAVRQGPEAQEVALPAQITATAMTLGGQSKTIAMRELRSGELLDYIGTVEVSPPDTLRFDVAVVREGGAQATMQFSREFYP